MQGSGKKETENILKERAHNKLAEMKELMCRYMSSPLDAFNNYDSSRDGTLTYSEFSHLVVQLYKAASKEVPTYQVMKDLYDCIDVRKDGLLDKHEWNQTFVMVSKLFLT